MSDDAPPQPPSRRDVLGAIGTLAVTAAVPGCGLSTRACQAPVTTGAGCVLTPKQVQGPFFLATGLERRDITEGAGGAPLQLRLTLIDAASCEPIPGAALEVWHANAAGSYSGFDISDGNLADHGGETFLRGYQRTDEQGQVAFTTVYPGWYPQRATHIHVTVLLGRSKLVTTQLYFDDALTDEIYAEPPYNRRGERDARNAEDTVSRWDSPGGPAPLIVDIERSPAGLSGQFVIGVRKA